MKEMVPACLANKGGRGDGTGRLSEDIIFEVRQNFLGHDRVRLPEREQRFMDYVATRCEPRSIFIYLRN